MLKGANNSWIIYSFIITTIVVFISENLEITGVISFFSGFRHVVILFVFFINWFLFGGRISFPIRYKSIILAIFIFIFFAYLVTQATLINYVLGIGFTFLFSAMFILGINTKTSEIDILKIFDKLLVVIIIMSIFPIIQVIFAQTTMRLVFGIFREVGAFASTMNIGAIIALSLYIITAKKKYLYIAFFFSFGIMMTIIKKTIISNVFVWFFFIFNFTSLNMRRRLLLFYSVLLMVMFFVYEADFVNNIANNYFYLERSGVEGHVRTGMYIAGFQIAVDYFPFGSGLGTFASLSSIVGGYSSLYFSYGVSNIGSNSASAVAAGHHTLLDTFWPHILGELGFIGTVLFLYLWFFPIKLALTGLSKINSSLIKGFSFYIILIIIVMTWEGFSLYTPEIPSFILLHSGLSGLCYYHLRKNLYSTLTNSL